MQFLPVEWHDALPSTNTFLRERLLADRGMPSGTVVAAREQTAGRGRYARTWMSRPGRDLAFSFLLREPVALAHVPTLPMAASLAVAHVLRRHGVAASVKWPNDVIVGSRKICGILSEYVPEIGPEPSLVVGIGLNVGMAPAEAEAIGRPATSIRIETGQEISPPEVLDQILAELPRWIAPWSMLGYAGLAEEWLPLATGVGQRAKVGEGERRKEGILEGFGPGGELLLRDDAGVLHTILMGDVVL